MGEDNFAMGYALGQDSGSNNGGMFGGDGWWALIIFAMIFGWGRGGFGGGFSGGGSGCECGGSARTAVYDGFALNNLDGGIRGIQQGICDSTYALNNAITGGFHGVDSSLCSLSRQLSECCCENRAAIAQVRYDMATQACDTRNAISTSTRDLIENQNANTRSILDFLVQDKITSLQAENQELRRSASQDRQNAYLTTFITAQNQQLRQEIAPIPVPSYTVPAPYPYCAGGSGYSYGCGCGCGV